MKNIYLEDLLDKTDSSIYKLVILATKRALEIAAGAPALVEADANTKPTTIALREISEGKVKFKKAK
ncbi:MAG: DNA-directed RNA polymerase subunit omega [Omnitrophica WOR_2 bacterium RIFCSPHIGHO2_02_FULL_45_21]|nr:MAG: DNA-directed RNA polymerase subunit omega [Omnitrophica WOR_2 bacterium RIFCSPHIGHO2_02_FULL_45_21]